MYIKREIDQVVVDGDNLHPDDIKKSSSVSKDWIKKTFQSERKFPWEKTGRNAVISLAEYPIPIIENIPPLPLAYLIITLNHVIEPIPTICYPVLDPNLLRLQIHYTNSPKTTT